MADAPISSAEARAIAKEASIYGYPMAGGYRIQHAPSLMTMPLYWPNEALTGKWKAPRGSGCSSDRDLR